VRLLTVYLSLGLLTVTGADIGVAVSEQPAAQRAAVTAPTVDDTHLVRAEELRATRDMHRRTLRAAARRAREVARAARAAAAARQHALAARAAAPRYVGSTAGITAVWRALAQCESSGNWHDTAGEYEGGVQLLNSTSLAYGGGVYARHAYDATPIEQVTVARRLLDADGPDQWPVCGPRVGLRRGD